LEGLEVKVLNYSEVLEDNFTYRIDAEFFKKTYLEEEKIIAKLGFEEAKNIIAVKGGKRLPEGHDFLNDKRGIPYIRAEDIKNGFVDYNNSPTISLITHREIKAYQTEYNDVLMTIVGNSIGDIGIVKFNLDICNLTENAVRLITKKNKIKPEYLFSFLESKFGQNYIERNKVGTAQPKLSIERIRKIKIPIISLEVQDEIEAIVSSAFEKLQKSKEIYQTAQNLLLEHLGLKDFNPPSQTVNIKSFTDSFGTSGRLDAEFYQEKYESYLKKIQAFNNGFVQIQQEYSQVKSKSKFDLPAYQYIEIGDVNVSDGSYSFNEVAIEDLPANAKIMVKEGDILISTVRPNRGAITVIEHDRDDLIVSGAFTVLRRKVKSYFNNEFLKVLLRTEIYKDWLLQFNVGTSYPVIKDEDILNLVIPNVEETIQTQIADLIRQSDRLRQESQALLEEAKRKVEQAIEG